MVTVGDIIGGGFRLIRERIGAVAVWAGLYLVMNVAVVLALRPIMAGTLAAQAAGAAPDPALMMAGMSQMFGLYLLLMIGLPLDTWLRLVIWMAVGLAVYFFYGRKHSVLRRKEGNAA